MIQSFDLSLQASLLPLDHCGLPKLSKLKYQADSFNRAAEDLRHRYWWRHNRLFHRECDFREGTNKQSTAVYSYFDIYSDCR